MNLLKNFNANILNINYLLFESYDKQSEIHLFLFESKNFVLMHLRHNDISIVQSTQSYILHFTHFLLVLSLLSENTPGSLIFIFYFLVTQIIL